MSDRARSDEIMLADEVVERLRRHWDEGWNGEDLEVIMAPFAEGVVFSSPYVARVSGDPSATSIVGRDALRAYVDAALRRTPGIRYTIHETFLATDSLVLTYRCDLPDGRVKEGADLMRVDADGLIVEWTSHYTTDSKG
jgi:hypothetical protein